MLIGMRYLKELTGVDLEACVVTLTFTVDCEVATLLEYDNWYDFKADHLDESEPASIVLEGQADAK